MLVHVISMKRPDVINEQFFHLSTGSVKKNTGGEQILSLVFNVRQEFIITIYETSINALKLKMQTVTVMNIILVTTWRQFPEESAIHSYRCENLEHALSHSAVPLYQFLCDPSVLIVALQRETSKSQLH
jgi:hypothetical protein